MIDGGNAPDFTVKQAVPFLLHTIFSLVLDFGKCALLIIILSLTQLAPAYAQIPKPLLPIPPKPAAPEKPPPPPAGPQAIPITDIAVQAEIALVRVRQLENRSRIDDLIETASEDIPMLARDTSYRLAEMRQLLTRNTALETIRTLEEEWRDIETRASALTHDLTRAALQLDRDIAELDALAATWDATGKAASQAGAPPEVLDRVRAVTSAVAEAKRQLLDDRAKVLALQSKSAEIGTRAANALQTLEDARERAVTRLLYRDSPPLWSATFWQRSINSFSTEAGEKLVSQTATLVEYLYANASRVLAHGLFFLGLVAILSLLQTKIAGLCETDGELQRTRQIYDMPVITGMLVALFFSNWFYLRPPRSLWVVISALGAFPVMVFARRVIDSGLYPMLYAIVGFYLADRLRSLFAPLPGVSRLMFMLEGVLITGFIFWTLHMSRRELDAPKWAQLPAWRVIRVGAGLALFLIVLALMSNVAGYVRLADLIIRSVVSSAYTAAVLYALTRVGEGVLLGLLYVPPLSMLRMVKRLRMQITRRLNHWLKWFALFGWIALTLNTTGLMRPFIAFVQWVWKASINIGSLRLSIGDVLTSFFIIWFSYALSRFVRFALEEEVYPNVRLDRGLPYAVSTMLHYIVLLTGFVLALGAIGLDMTRFTILAGAFSVGIGFGLQNIVNNFVSGLIVLFERPIKVGDTIQIDDIVGRVQHIGIRASIVQSTTGAEVIIPNGKLISDKVTNWTLSNQLRQITVPVITKADIDVGQLKEILLDVARKDKRVVRNPPPEVLFIKRAIDTLEFELRIWTDDLDNWLSVKSDLITEINEALRQREMAAQAQAHAPAPLPAPSAQGAV
ncbi:MAG: potassium-dependent mechanosensitive channel [Burkholderiales bacterium]